MLTEINVRFKEPEYTGDEPDQMVEVCLVKEGQNSVNVQVILSPEELTPPSAIGKYFCIHYLKLCLNCRRSRLSYNKSTSYFYPKSNRKMREHSLYK